jgi:hypothetical protein
MWSLHGMDLEISSGGSINNPFFEVCRVPTDTDEPEENSGRALPGRNLFHSVKNMITNNTLTQDCEYTSEEQILLDKLKADNIINEKIAATPVYYCMSKIHPTFVTQIRSDSEPICPFCDKAMTKGVWAYRSCDRFLDGIETFTIDPAIINPPNFSGLEP